MGKHNQQRRKSLVLFKHGPLPVVQVLFVFLFVLLTAFTAISVKPQHQANAAESSYLNFQARLQTAAGAIVPDGNYHIEFKLYNAATSGTSSQGSCSGDANCLWTETRSTGHLVTVKNGYLSVNLGSVTALPNIDWSQQLWLTMRIGGSAGSASWDGEMSPRLPLTALPYSFYAKQAGDSDTLDGLDSTAFAQASGSGNYIQNGTSPQTADFNITGDGTVGGALTVGGAASIAGDITLSQGASRTIQVGTRTTNAAGNDLLLKAGAAGSGASAYAGGSLRLAGGDAAGTGNANGGSIYLYGGAAVGSGSAGNLVLAHNGTSAVGRVGIGTGAPVSLLNVGQYSDSVTSLTLGDDANAANYGLSAFNNNLKLVAPTGFRFLTGSASGTEVMTLSGGKLGIGVPGGPAYQLDVNGDANIASGSVYRVGGTAGVAVTCSGGQFLQNATTVGGIVTGGSCAAGAAGGVTTVGTFSNTSIANGASITGSTITFGAADGTNPGMVSTGTQTFAGAKTFNDTISTTQLTSTSTTGTAPLVVSSTTKVANLNADLLDGLDSTGFILNGTAVQTANAYLQSATNGDATLTLKMKSGQTAGALSVLDSAGGALAAIDNGGGIFAQQIAANDTITGISYSTTHSVFVGTAGAANATVPVMVLQGGATPGSGADLLQLKNSSNQVLSGFSNAGQLYLGRASGAVGSLKLFNATNSNTVSLQSGVTSSSYVLTLPTALGSTNDCLKDGGSGALVFSACATAGGVTTVGTISGSSIVNGASISGNTITFGAADASGPGMVTNGTQTLAGDKTLTGSTTVSKTGTSALKVQNSGGTVTALTADTSSGYVGVGTASPSRTLDVAVNNTQVASPMALFEQAGTGDAGIELKNANTSWYTGIDTSNSNAFTLNSNAASVGSTSTTLGQDYSSASPNNTDINQGSVGATKFTASATGTVSSLSVAFSSTLSPGTSKFSVAIYSDNGSGTAPVNLLGKYTGTVNVVTPSPGSVNWNTATLDSPVSVTSGTVYWLAIAFNDDSPYKVRTTGGTSTYRGGVTAGTWGSTWNSNGNTNLGGSSYEQGVYGTIVTLGSLTDTYANSLLSIGTTGVTTFRNSTNSTAAFSIQNAASTSIFSVDTTNAAVVLGTASSQTGKLVFANSSNANLVTIQSGTTSASYTLTLPTAAASTGQCLAAGTVSGTSVPLTFTSCGASGAVTTVGTISSSSQTNGATISGNTITFGAADASGPGMVTNGTQTFGGDKTFNGSLTMAAGATTFIQTYNSTAAGTAHTINLTNGSGTNTNGLLINRNAASGTTTNGINVTNTAGTLTNGLAFTGTIGTDINRGTGILSLNGASGITLQNAGSTIATVSSTGVSVTGVVNASTNLQTGGTTRIDNTGALTNVTGSTAILTSGTLGLARGGTNNTTYTTNGIVYSDGTKLTSTGAGTTGQCLVATTSAAPSWGTCSSTSGVTTVGSFSSTSIANGASISGSTITFGAADGTNPGMVSTGDQTFAGNKTFSGQVKVNTTVASDFALQGINSSATGLGIYGYANSNNGTSDVLRLDGSGGTVLSVKTNGTTTVKGGSIVLQNSTGTTSFFSATSSGTTLQNSSGVDMFNFDVSTGHLKIYEAGGSHRYADVYYDTANNEAVFAASSGNTRVGSGSGNITLQLSNASDVLTFSKTVSLGSAYSGNDFTITRNLTSGANSETGSVLKVESTGSASGTVSPNILLLNQSNASATGYLINAQTGGAAKFQVSTAGTVTLAAGQSINGAGALTVASGSSTALTLSGPSGITLQSTGGNVQVGSASGDTTATQLVLDSYSISTDPSGSNGAMYYNSSMAKFRCRENGAWTNCITALPVSVTLTADRTNSTTTPANVTDLSFNLAANTKYYYKFVIAYQATGATTTGIGFGITTTQTPFQSQWCTNTSPNNTAGTATGASYCGTGDASATSAGVGVTSTNFEQEFDGYIQGNASLASVLQLRFKSEVGSSAVVVKAGSYGILTPVQ